jgi:hypothetical protein
MSPCTADLPHTCTILDDHLTAFWRRDRAFRYAKRRLRATTTERSVLEVLPQPSSRHGAYVYMYCMQFMFAGTTD